MNQGKSYNFNKDGTGWPTVVRCEEELLGERPGSNTLARAEDHQGSVPSLWRPCSGDRTLPVEVLAPVQIDVDLEVHMVELEEINLGILRTDMRLPTLNLKKDLGSR